MIHYFPSPFFGTGTIAQKYEELGGSCVYFGKPYKEHFEACIDQLGVPKHRIAHVGDSLHHDVAGANGAGVSSIFVTGGIHHKELNEFVGSENKSSAPLEIGDLPDESKLQLLFDKHGQTPTHIVPMLKVE